MPLCANARGAVQARLRENGMRISLEGNIGAGKSTVTAVLASRGYVVAPEPVEAWTLLPRFYAEPRKYAFALQAQILTSCAALGSADNDTLITERGAEASLHVFGAALQESGRLTQRELCILQSLYILLPLVKPSAVVYLDAPPAVCLARVEQRGRACEAGMTLEYLQCLHAHYETYLRECGNESRCRVTRVDCSAADPEQVADAVEDVLAAL